MVSAVEFDISTIEYCRRLAKTASANICHFWGTMTDEEPQTVRARVYEIRRALGPDHRTPLTQGEFAKRANAIAARFGLKANYDASFISKIENGTRTVGIEEIPVFAALDPMKRGDSWLAWGVMLPAGSVLDLDPTRDHLLTDEEAGRAEAQADERARAARRATKHSAGGKKKR